MPSGPERPCRNDISDALDRFDFHFFMIMAPPNSAYNNIRLIDEHYEDLKGSQFARACNALCDIYLKHHAHRNFGIALLHRHHALPSEHVMVHSMNDAG